VCVCVCVLANYLEWPNNLTSFCRKNYRFPVLCKYLYNIGGNTVDDYISLTCSKSLDLDFGGKAKD
ncbi:MAG: hypothetical protein ACTTKN_08620, partial [Phocaeicola sp.]|uniref:hypothetical protein n=1 Tax=Phocaeicola sp. TaxID=2773926 RepID=UPI003F9FA046